MAPSVRIEGFAFTDVRIAILGTVAGYNRHEALGRLAALWSYCTERQLYVVPMRAIEEFLGHGGANGLIESGLGESDVGGIRVRGTAGRIEWLEKRRAAARLGGESNRDRLAKRKPNGSQTEAQRPVIGPVDSVDNQPNESQTRAKREPSDSPLSVTLTPTLTLVREIPEKEIVETSAKPSKRKAKRAEYTAPELASVRVVLEKLGARNGVAYRAADSHARLIVARLREGLTEMDLRHVVAYCAVKLKWANDPKFATYLRPETLFGSETVWRYVEPARAWFESERKSQ